MFKLIDKILQQFSPCFNRIETFSWFIVIVVGMILRIDVKGLTTIVNCMMIKPKYYESMMHFFRSNGFNLTHLKERWFAIVNEHVEPVTIDDKQIILGDHIKIMKEARYMPGVKKHHQDSENVGKAEYIFGHQHGMIGLLAKGETYQCIPLNIEIQGGTAQIENMDFANDKSCDNNNKEISETDDSKKDTIVKKMSELTEKYVEFTGKKAIYILDAFFPSQNIFNRIKDFNEKYKNDLITLIVRAKSNFVGFKDPKPDSKAKYGDKVKLISLFDKIDEIFTKTTLLLYGKKEDVYYYCVNLTWKPIDRKIRFVFAKTGNKTMILMCSDLTLDPEKIIIAYTYRFKIEVSFKYLKHTLGGFCYHFWTNALPKLSRYCTINDLSNVICKKKQKRIFDTLRAIEVFTFLSSVAYGIMTIVALNYSDNIWSKYTGWIRTKSSNVPSLETVRATLLKEYYNISPNLSTYATLHNINKYKQDDDFENINDGSDTDSRLVSGF